MWILLIQSFCYSRKCKLSTTGPWLQVESDISFVDVAVQIDPGDAVHHSVAVWAASTKGDVFVRDGVTSSCPKVCHLRNSYLL